MYRKKKNNALNDKLNQSIDSSVSVQALSQTGNVEHGTVRMYQVEAVTRIITKE